MDFKHFKAGTDDSGRRIDKILRRFLSEESLAQVYKSLRKGLIRVNGKKCDGNYRVSENDDIQIAQFLLSEIKKEVPSGIFSPLPEEIVIFRNNDFLILNKPYDISVQPGNGLKSLSEMVDEDYSFHHKNPDSLSFRCGPLHRLDRKTTGIIVFSQSLRGAQWFSESIKIHTSKKIYVGLCCGNLKASQCWEDSLKKNENESAFKTVEVNAPENGKQALTCVTPLGHGNYDGKAVTLVKFEIITGRTHQIRAQSAFHGFPLLGDTAYGGNPLDSKKTGQDFFLHAYRLEFPEDRMEGLPAVIECPVSDKFKKILSLSLINENFSVKI